MSKRQNNNTYTPEEMEEAYSENKMRYYSLK